VVRSLGAVAFGSLLAIWPAAAGATPGVPGASAAGPVNGCVASAPAGVPGATAPTTCQYVAGSTTGSFAAATPNHWVITIGSAVVAQGGADTPNPAGTYPQAAGDTVTVILYQDCAPPGMPCGAAGAVAAGDAPG
jgi:hypothetical protein